MNIGFVATQDKKEFVKDCFLNFDNGEGIDSYAACHNTLITGATGTGKTRDIILSMSDRLLAYKNSEGYRLGGLIIDVKGNFIDQIENIATENLRFNDIERIGIQENATKYNLLANVEDGLLFNFYKQLAITVNGHDRDNGIWLSRGVSQAVDCTKILRKAEKYFPNIHPSLTEVRKMMQDPIYATALAIEVEKVLPEEEAAAIRKRRTCNAFHVCNYVPVNMRGCGQKGSDYEAQVTWTTEYVTMVLDEILSIPGMAEAIDGENAKPFDAREFVTGGKIGVVRFGPESGFAGNIMARKLIEEFYRAVYAAGVTKSPRCFLLADEFQHFADLSGSRFSDDSFTSQAREFGTVCCYATQSVAMLDARNNNSRNNKNGFLANCCNRISFWTDDPETNGLFMKRSPESLDVGECTYTIFDSANRKRISGSSSLNNEYERVEQITSTIKSSPC